MSSLSTHTLRRPFQMNRDEAGVPHIRAENWLDALYGLGYMHATDRATQLLFGRAVAAGRAAGLIADKEELLETDELFLSLIYFFLFQHQLMIQSKREKNLFHIGRIN